MNITYCAYYDNNMQLKYDLIDLYYAVLSQHINNKYDYNTQYNKKIGVDNI